MSQRALRRQIREATQDLPHYARACPECGMGPVVEDGAPCTRKAFRYSVACPQDCLITFGPTVKEAIDDWARQAGEMIDAKNKQTTPTSGDSKV